jgi:hypothetical protein
MEGNAMWTINTFRLVASVVNRLANVVRTMYVLISLLMLCVFFAVILVVMFVSKITGAVFVVLISKLRAIAITIMRVK